MRKLLRIYGSLLRKIILNPNESIGQERGLPSYPQSEDQDKALQLREKCCSQKSFPQTVYTGQKFSLCSH